MHDVLRVNVCVWSTVRSCLAVGGARYCACIFITYEHSTCDMEVPSPVYIVPPSLLVPLDPPYPPPPHSHMQAGTCCACKLDAASGKFTSAACGCGCI